MTPQEEATEMLASVIADLTDSQSDLISVLRRCQHICQLLGWNDPREWFRRELAGYSHESDVPEHRKIKGYSEWQHPGSSLQKTQQVIADSVWGVPISVPPDQTEPLVLGGPIEVIISSSTSGYSRPTGVLGKGYSRKEKRDVQMEAVDVFPASSFQRALNDISRIAYDFASQSYTVLRYGNAVDDFWAEFRTRVESALQSANLTSNLDAIQVGLKSQNPEEWRHAVFGCRNLLEDVAAHLWRDTRNTYDLLDGSGPNDKLQVTRDRFANRLRAYLHQKGITSNRGGFMRDELNRLGDSIRSLINLQNAAHSQMDRSDVVSLGIATYFILGELVTKTDMLPVETYHIEPRA